MIAESLSLCSRGVQGTQRLSKFSAFDECSFPLFTRSLNPSSKRFHSSRFLFVKSVPQKLRLLLIAEVLAFTL